MSSTSVGTDVQPESLSKDQQDMLRLEGRPWLRPGAKEQAIFDRFAMPSTRYYQQLNQLINLPEALAFAPMTVNRLRRAIARREARR